jgi:hypothetical protein
MLYRIDDVGAASKRFEQHSRHPWANFWFLKTLPGLRGWGPYRELTAEEWRGILLVFEKNNIKPLVAITAAWVERDSSLVPFPKKFPAAAELLKQALHSQLIDVANHGLTHCIVGRHLPKLLESNRSAHREFWPELPEQLHHDHILHSQKILEDFFDARIEKFVPPGNVWSIKTYRALQQSNIKQVIANRYMLDSTAPMLSIEFIDDNNIYIVMHDRDIKISGNKWLARKLNTTSDG